jgi:hypothetical protein
MKRPPPSNGFFTALRTKIKAYDDTLASLSWEAIVASLKDSLDSHRDDGQRDAVALTAALVEHVVGSPKPPPRLCIQAWVPEPIACYFRESYEAAVAAGPYTRLRAWLRGSERLPEFQGTVSATGERRYRIEYESLDIVVRLAGHRCMRAFYEELFRKDGDAYVYPAVSPAIGEGREGEDDADSRQVTAVVRLLDAAAVQAAKVRITPPLTKAEARQRYEIVTSMYQLLRLGYDLGDPGLDPDPGFGQAGGKADRAALDSAAAVYKKRAEGYQREMESAPVYRSRHSRDRMLVVRIGEAMQRLFGVRGMYGTVANLATAALGHEITKVAVQKWLAHSAGNTPPYKKGS